MARQVRPSAQRQVQRLRPARFPALRWGSLPGACFLGSHWNCLLLCGLCWVGVHTLSISFSRDLPIKKEENSNDQVKYRQ